MSVAVPDRRVTAPKPERGRRSAATEEAAPPLNDHPAPIPANGHRELRWVRHRNEWVVELVVVVPDEGGLAPV